MSIEVKRKIEYSLNGRYIIGEIKSPLIGTDQYFYPQFEGIAKKCGESISPKTLELLIKELQAVKEMLDSKRVASALIEQSGEDTSFYLK